MLGLWISPLLHDQKLQYQIVVLGTVFHKIVFIEILDDWGLFSHLYGDEKLLRNETD